MDRDRAVHFMQRPIKGRQYWIRQVIPAATDPILFTVAHFEDLGDGEGVVLLTGQDGRQVRRQVLYGPLGVVGI